MRDDVGQGIPDDGPYWGELLLLDETEPADLRLTDDGELKKKKRDKDIPLRLPGLKRKEDDWLETVKQEIKVEHNEETLEKRGGKNRPGDLTNRSVATTMMCNKSGIGSNRSDTGDPIPRDELCTDGLFSESDEEEELSFENGDESESRSPEYRIIHVQTVSESERSADPAAGFSDRAGPNDEVSGENRKSVSMFHRPEKLEPEEEEEFRVRTDEPRVHKPKKSQPMARDDLNSRYEEFKRDIDEMTNRRYGPPLANEMGREPQRVWTRSGTNDETDMKWRGRALEPVNVTGCPTSEAKTVKRKQVRSTNRGPSKKTRSRSKRRIEAKKSGKSPERAIDAGKMKKHGAQRASTHDSREKGTHVRQDQTYRLPRTGHLAPEKGRIASTPIVTSHNHLTDGREPAPLTPR